ncbi:MAG: hypothetical protein ACON3Z_01720 [Bradymonadia bacterium]
MHNWIPMGIALILVAGCGRTTSMKRDEVDASFASTESDASIGRGDVGEMDVTVSDARIADAAPLDLDGGMVMSDGAIDDSDMLAVDVSVQSDGDAPDVSPQFGHIATSCGSPSQGIMPVDCTARGDVMAACVFSNHCMCSEGFYCESEENWPGTNECDPGSICLPE